MSMNNPAGRLLAILRAAVDIHPHTQNPEAWRKLLGLSEHMSKLELLERVGVVYKLPNHVRTEILKLEGEDHDLLLDWTPHIQAAFYGHSVGGTWNHFKEHLRPESLRSLAHCDSLLSRRARQPVLEKSQLDEIAERVKALREDVEGADLDPELKQFILLHFHEIHIAIANYPILGAPGISKAANDAIGEIVFKRPNGIIAFLDSELGQRVKGFLFFVATEAQAGSSVSRLLEAAEHLVTILRDVPSPGPMPERPPNPLRAVDGVVLDEEDNKEKN